MQKFVLTSLLLGALVALFYYPIPMDQLERGLENGSLLYQAPAQKTLPNPSNHQYRASNELNQPLDSDPILWSTKKNQKKIEGDALLTFTFIKN